MENIIKVQLNEIQIDEYLRELRGGMNTTVVSRYKKNCRNGAKFPPLVLEKKTYKLVSGNHRYDAMMDVFGEEYVVDAILRTYENRKEYLKDFLRENSEHGYPLVGKRRNEAIYKLVKNDHIPECEIGKILNIPADEDIFVQNGILMTKVGTKKTGYTEKVIKRGAPIAHKKITPEQYAEHITKDKSGSFKSLTKQVIRWLNFDWISEDDYENVRHLYKAIELFRNRNDAF